MTTAAKKATKKKAPPIPLIEELPVDEPRKHADRRRVRVMWSLDIPTDGHGKTSVENVAMAIRWLDHVVNSVSQWAASDENPNPVKREIVRESAKKPRLVAYWTLNRGLAHTLCRKSDRFTLVQ